MLDQPVMTHVNAQEIIRFLDLIDPNATRWFVQSFDERGSEPSKNATSKGLPRQAIPYFANAFIHRGMGVGLAPNEIEGGRRIGEAVTRVRAVWHEDDDGYDGDFPLDPSIVVQSSEGKRHRYWLIEDDWPTDEQGRKDFKRVMASMVEQFGSDPNPIDINRALRLPGTRNNKYDHAPLVEIVLPANGEAVQRYARKEILSAFTDGDEDAIDTTAIAKPSAGRGAADNRRIADALSHIPADDRAIWLKVGAAIHDETSGSDAGFKIWDDWSRGTKSRNFNEADQHRTWRGYKRNHIDPTTIATVFQIAKENGWQDNRALPPGASIPEERLAIARSSNDLTERTMKAVRERLLDYGNHPAEEFFAGMEEPAKLIQAMANGDEAIGRAFYISSLAPGVGKTTTVVESIRAMMGMPEYEHVGAIIFLSQVDQIKSFIEDSKLDEGEFSVIVSKSYQDKVPLGNPWPERARILLTTQQMLEARLKDGGDFADIKDFRFSGKPRQVRIWDEAILPSKIHTVGQYKIPRLFDGFARLKKQSLIDDLEALYATLKSSGDKQTIMMPDIEAHGISMEQAQEQFRDDEDRAAVEAIWRLSARTVNVRWDHYGLAALGYHDVFPEDLGPLLILDASGPLRQVYTDWSTDRKTLKGLYSPAKSYKGLTIHFQDKGSGQDQFKLKNTGRFDLYKGFIREAMTFPRDERTLFICRKPDRRTADIADEITKLLPWNFKAVFRTWGMHTATNDFVDCSRVMLLSVLQYPTSHNEALGRSAKKLPPEDRLSDDDFDGTRYGEIMHNIYQAANRSRIRMLEGDSCPEGCHLYIRFSTKVIPREILERVFPGATIIDWEPVIELKGHQEKLAMMIAEDATPEGTKKTKKHYREQLGISPQHFTSLLNDKLVRWLSEEGGVTLKLKTREMTIKLERPQGSTTEKGLREELPF